MKFYIDLVQEKFA